MRGEPVHICLGCCRYEAFEPGDPVELSIYGWAHGLAVNYAYTVGEVVGFDKGILTVRRYGTQTPLDFHPCFWKRSTRKSVDDIRRREKKEFATDYLPYENDDFYFDDKR